MTCGHCGATVPEDSDRCRKCLRRTLLVASDPPPKAAAPAAPLTRRARIIRSVLALVGAILVIAVVRAAMRHILDL
jgi:hypothetical protein